MMKHNEDLSVERSTEDSTKIIDLPEGVPYLNTFYLYITNGCNLFCRHCWITPSFVDGKPSPGDCLELELLKIAVKRGKALGLSQSKLTGGEPVLHPRFIEIVDFLSRENIRLNMETNATLITADLAKYLKNDTTLWFVSTSLDSPHAESHDRFRGLPGAFKAALMGTEHLVNAGYRPQIIMSPHRGNIHLVEDMVKLAVKIGAGSVKFNPVTPTGRGMIMDKKGETLDFDETMDLVHFIRGELQDKYNIRLIISTPPALSTIKDILREKNAGGECRVLSILGILGTGDMALCGIGRNIPELCFGHLGKNDLKEVWVSHPILAQLRQDLKGNFHGICGDCIHAKRCLTHCVAINYVRTGKLVHPDILCEEAERRGIFPETRRRSYMNNPKKNERTNKISNT